MPIILPNLAPTVYAAEAFKARDGIEALEARDGIEALRARDGQETLTDR